MDNMDALHTEGRIDGADDQWVFVTRVFEEALVLPPADRGRFVIERCAGRDDVVHEVIGLIDAHERSGEFLTELDPVKALSLFESPEDAPEFAGPFRLVEEIGRGGMAVVYLGKRSDGLFDRQVAVKVIKRGMDSDAIKSRFLRERRILAALEHPHIGRLYDGGVTDKGQPYFAMEYVDGLPLTDYCDLHKLTVNERLSLFEQGCRAVQYAHQNLVIHRDLKPSNMLVDENDQLKLLDFGIAKLLNDSGTDGISTTVASGHQVLTPQYASPEQLSGSAVTTASDVYSLGIVLYELLSGVRPYSVASRNPVEIEQSISDSKVLAPSASLNLRMLASNDDFNASSPPSDHIARNRRTTPSKLRRVLRGDLDNIVLKAMRKEPARRYASVEGLVEDLRRYRTGLPVEARPESVSYRARKYVERHLIGVALGVLMTPVLLGALALSLNLAHDKALETAKAQQVTQFMASMFASSDPDRTQGTEITVLELLDEGSTRIQTELEDQPEVQAELMDVMGQVHMKLGLYEKSEALHRAALSRRRAVFGDRHPLVAASLRRTGVALRGQARWPEASVVLREAADMQRELLGRNSEEFATTLYDLAWIEAQQNGNYEAADSLNRLAVSIFEETVGHHSEQVARGLYSIGWIEQKLGLYESAANNFRESLAIWRSLAGDQHRSVAKNISGLAMVLMDLKQFDEAEKLYREALQIRLEILASDHPDVATSLNNLGAVLRNKGDYSEAAEYFGRACELYRGRLGERHPYTAVCEQNLGSALAGAGRVDEGIELLRTVLDTRIDQIGADHPEIAITHIRLGDAYRLRDAPMSAEREFRRALSIWTSRLGDDHPETATAQVRLAVLLQELGRKDEAEILLNSALQTQSVSLGPDHEETVQTRALLGG